MIENERRREGNNGRNEGKEGKKGRGEKEREKEHDGWEGMRWTEKEDTEEKGR